MILSDFASLTGVQSSPEQVGSIECRTILTLLEKDARATFERARPRFKTPFIFSFKIQRLFAYLAFESCALAPQWYGVHF